MIEEVRQSYAEAVEESGKQLTTDPFFSARASQDSPERYLAFGS